ncbi:ATP-dependent DNA helicase RecG [Candidatus Woesebacteria bacterium]|nr:ATP-dependent DNA helicase RecG [Candidatus Woesebacteria bacterium]
MELKDISGIGEKTLSSLEKHGITTIHGLLTHFPRTYRTYRATTINEIGLPAVASAKEGEWISLVGRLSRPVSHHTTHTTTQLSTFQDESGRLTLRWFNSPFIVRSVVPSETYLVRGQLTIFGNTRQIVSPQLTKVSPSYLAMDELMPIYPSLGVLKSGNLRKIIYSALGSTPPFEDPLSPKIREKHHLIDLNTAIHIVHRPQSKEVLETAIRRLAFDELYTLQLESQANSELYKVKTTPLNWNTESLNNWITNLPYIPTGAQTRVIGEILSDLQKPIAMHRLLAGEVGSGKTLVAAAAIFASHNSGHQSLVMAPTQILAEQLYASFKQLLGNTLAISLVTASSKGDVQADVVVGTQALLTPKHKFENVGLVIVDEQHKFGVKQREYLSSLTPAPHVLMMTATPIPRTLAMTIFSNMDISRLDELPKNRLPIKTYLVGEEKRDRAFTWIKSEVINNHNQAFVVVPLIEEAEDDEGNAKKSLKLLESDLNKRFPGLKIDIMHGKMKDTEKTEHLRAFRDGITQILVATSMVEVGIDIPGANIMVIEDAERFGLAQLHQLRGRVGRGSTQGHCLIFTSSDKPKIKERLTYFAKEINGEQLAMYDLDNRGPGELFGESQSGFFSLHFASIYDTALLKETYEAVRIHSI